MYPVANSGYSIGSLQTDLGQHRSARAADDVPTELIDHYQAWARANARERPGWLLDDAQRSQTIADLQRQGNEITRDQGVDIDSTIKSRLNAFLASDDGIAYVHGRDTAQIGKLMRDADGPGNAGSSLTQLQATTLYQSSSLDDQAGFATIVAKLENQGGDRYFPRVIAGINNGTINSVEDAKAVVDRILPNRANGGADYIEDGVNHALKGTEVLNAPRNSDPRSPVHAAWQHVVADPLVSPVDLRRMNMHEPEIPGPLNVPRVDQAPVWQPAWERAQEPPMPPLRVAGANPDLPAEYATIKTLFLSPDQGKSFIRALDQGASYSYGRPQAEGRNRPTAGFYVSGDDFVVWNQDGQGHAFIGGNWRDIDRSNLARVRNDDGTIDINMAENGTTSRLLHVDPRAPALRPQQQEIDLPVQVPGRQHPPDGPGRHDRDEIDRQQVPHAPPQRGAMSLDSPQHENAGMYAALLAIVHDRDDKLGRVRDETSQQLAGGLTETARRRELTTIGFAQFNSDGSKVYMTDSKDPSLPWARTAVAEVGQLVGQPLAQSSENVAKINEQLSLKQELVPQALQHGVSQNGSTIRGPMLS